MRLRQGHDGEDDMNRSIWGLLILIWGLLILIAAGLVALFGTVPPFIAGPPTLFAGDPPRWQVVADELRAPYIPTFFDLYTDEVPGLGMDTGICMLLDTAPAPGTHIQIPQTAQNRLGVRALRVVAPGDSVPGHPGHFVSSCSERIDVEFADPETPDWPSERRVFVVGVGETEWIR